MPDMMQQMFLYQFRFDDIKPLMDIQKVLRDRAFMMFWEKKAAPEELMEKKEEPMIKIAKTGDKTEAKVGTKSQKEETATYSISYYNPVLKKEEVLESTMSITMDDTAKKIIEESAGAQSVYPLYSFIASPILMKEINPYILKEVLDNREYDTPPPSSGGAAARIKPQEQIVQAIIIEHEPPRTVHVKAVDSKGIELPRVDSKVVNKSVAVEVVAVTPNVVRVTEAKTTNVVPRVKPSETEVVVATKAVEEVIKRKEHTEEKLETEIVQLEHVVGEINKGRGIHAALRQLGPITRARFLTALNKKGLSKSVLLLLLERDISFLKSIKKKLLLLSVDDLVDLVKAMGVLQKKK